CRMHHYGEQVALRIDRNVPLTAFDLLPCIITALPPFPAVFTDWESIIARLGWAVLPTFNRPCCRICSSTVSHNPKRRQRRKRSWTAFQGGYSCGNCRHWQPVLRT